jgi:CBS domain-containing protein
LGGAQALGWSVQGSSGPPAAILGWLGWINIVPAIFNMMPGYPLDGGRVLRATLWWRSGDVERATRNAASAGQVVGGALILLGLLQFVSGAGVGGLWLAFIGWFLLDAARTSYSELVMTAGLRGVRAGDVMASDCGRVTDETRLDEFVNLLLHSGRRCFIATGHDDTVVGLITPQEVRTVDRSRWSDVRVADVMRRLQDLRTVASQTPLIEALRIMSRDDINQLPVVDNGRLTGVLTRGHLLRLIQTRAELTG